MFIIVNLVLLNAKSLKDKKKHSKEIIAYPTLYIYPP